MAQQCRHGSFVIFQGIWTSIAKKPYSFAIFQGGGGGGGHDHGPSRLLDTAGKAKHSEELQPLLLTSVV